MDSIGDTFLDHSPSDRLMLMLAVQKLAWGLISAMGEAIQQAAQSEANEEVEVALEDDGAAYLQTSVTSGRGEVPDETSYMQAISSEGDPWQQLLQELCLNWKHGAKTTADRSGWWIGSVTGVRTMLLGSGWGICRAGRPCSRRCWPPSLAMQGQLTGVSVTMTRCSGLWGGPSGCNHSWNATRAPGRPGACRRGVVL